jgi:hypothetical protein
MDIAKTRVFAVCVHNGRNLRSSMLALTVRSFLAQDYAGASALVVVLDGDMPDCPVLEHPNVHVVRIPGREYTIGELRNASKTYVQHQVQPDRKLYAMCHMDVGVYYGPDYLTNVVQAMAVKHVGMLQAVTVVDLCTGQSFLQPQPRGTPQTLFYDPSLPLAFRPTQGNVVDEFIRTLREPLRDLKKSAQPHPIQILPASTAQVVRFYDGRVKAEHANFMAWTKGSQNLPASVVNGIGDIIAANGLTPYDCKPATDRSMDPLFAL